MRPAARDREAPRLSRPSHGRSTPSAWPIAMGLSLSVLLVGGGILMRTSMQEAADIAARGEADTLLRSARHTIMTTAPAETEEALALLLDEQEPEGLRYVAVIGPNGEILVSAGEPARDLAPRPPTTVTPDPRPGPGQLSNVGDRLRVIEDLWPPHGPGPGRRGRGRRVGASVFREPRAGRGPQRLVVELEPLTANQLAVQADLLLWFALGTVAIVLLLSALFARVLNQRARLATELERDRQLAALGEMSAVLAHELRNPLASLKGHAQLLVESLTPGAAPERKAQRVVDEAVRIEHLISDLLEFARTGELNRQAIDAWDIVLAAAEDVGKDLVRLESPGTTKPENGRPRRWRLDGARVEQSLGNVLRNAVQASPPGDKPVVSLGLDGDDLVITVRDFGDGITPGDEERIFAPFHTGRVRGTGLGLAIARRIVERHGGQIVAGNHPDGGAEIRLIFPGDARVLETAPETAPGTEPAGSSSGPARGVDSRGADE